MTTTVNIPHSRPLLDQEEARAVAEVVLSGHVSQGHRVEEFEREVAAFIGLHGGVAVGSGTAALELALLALEVENGDEVIMPSYVCSAPWIATARLGAVPRIVDIEPSGYAIDPDKVAQIISRRTKAIIVPHMFGLPADLAKLRSFGVPLIEDCAQTLGSTQAGITVGSVGDLTVCSFSSTKLLCTGEGGMVLSNQHAVLEKVRALRAYDEQPVLTARRFNFKMTDIQAALGLCQLKRLKVNLEQRIAIAARYFAALCHLPVELPAVPKDRTHVFYRFVMRVSQRLDELIVRLASRGVQCRKPVFQPLHRYLKLSGYPESDQAFSTALSIPIYPSLTTQETDYTIQMLCEELA